MIRLFSHTETDFTHNGIHVLDDIALGDTCILSNGINEVYSLEMEVSIYNNSKWKDIESEMILKVPTPKGEQLFRIKEVVKGFSTIKIYGKHIFFDLENNFILDTNIVKKDGRSAIAQILGAMTNNMVNSFHGTSDISNFNNSRLVRKNVVTALIGDDNNSFLNRWGGELELNNFNFSINERIGSDRGFQIRYGKNATGYEGNINTYNLCTRIVPVGFDGLMLEGTKWVDSPNIAKYPQIYTYEVKFDDIKVKENEDDEEGYNTIEEAREALREAAVNYFTSTECDLPSFSAIVNFITLRNTEEFKNVKALETVALGDDVSIYLSNIDVNASSRVVREKWNFFTKKHVELEIGEIKPNVFKQLINIKDTIDNIVESLGGNTWQDIINKSLDEATKLMEEGLKGSHVITMKNQIVIGDAPDIKDMVNCIVFNKNGIGFSNNGYLPDRLVSAMTIDGKINASCITTGELNAALIKTGVLMSANGKTWINMDDGSFNLADALKFIDGKLSLVHSNGTEGITIDKGGIKVTTYSSTNGMEDVAKIIATSFAKDRDQNGLSICTTGYGDYIQVGYEKEDGNIRAAVYFVPNSIPASHGLPYSDAGIYIYDPIFLKNSLNIKSSDVDHQLVNLSGNYLGIYGDNGLEFGYKSGTALKTRLKIHESPPSGTGDLFESYGNWNFKGYTLHNINIQNSNLTNNYANLDSRSAASVTALESCEEDTIRYIYKDIRSIGNKIILNIPNKYKGCNYRIIGVAKKGFGDYSITSEEDARFTIETDRELIMNIEISIDTSYLKKTIKTEEAIEKGE